MPNPNLPLADQVGQTTGNDAADEQARIAALVEAELKRHNLTQQAQANGLSQADLEKLLASGDTKPQEYTVTLGGQTYKYNSPEEMNAAIQSALEQAVLRGQQLATQAVLPKEQPKADVYDEKQFETILAQQGTPAALAYAMRFSPIQQELESLKAANAALRMKQTAAEVKEIVPGFRPKDAREIAIVDSIRQEFGGAPDNPRAWEAAVATAVSRGLVKLDSAGSASQTGNTQTQNTAGVQPPPFMGNTQGANAPDPAKRYAELMDLPLEAIERLRRQAFVQ